MSMNVDSDTTSHEELLPDLDYLVEHGLFRLRDGSLGVLFEALPAHSLPDSQPMSTDQVTDLVHEMTCWFALPSNCILQVIYDTFEIEKASMTQRASPRVLVSIIWQARVRPFLNERAPDRRGFLRFTRIVRMFQQRSRTPLKRLGPSELIDYLRAFFIPKTHLRHRYTPYDPDVSIVRQAWRGDRSKGRNREGVVARVILLEQVPQYLLPGNSALWLSQLPFPARLALEFTLPARRELLKLVIKLTIEGLDEAELHSREIEAIRLLREDYLCVARSQAPSATALLYSCLPLGHGAPHVNDSVAPIRISKAAAARLMPVFDSVPVLADSLGLCVSPHGELIRMGIKKADTPGHVVIVADHDLDRNGLFVDIFEAERNANRTPLVYRIKSNAATTLGIPEVDDNVFHFDPNYPMPISPFHGTMDESRLAFLSQYLEVCMTSTSPGLVVSEEHRAALAAALRNASHRKKMPLSMTIVDGRLLQEHESAIHPLNIQAIVDELTALPSGSFQEFSIATIETLRRGLAPYFGQGIFSRFISGTATTARVTESPSCTFDLQPLESRPALMMLSLMALTEVIRTRMLHEQNSSRLRCILLDHLVLASCSHPGVHRVLSELLAMAQNSGLWTVAVMPRPQDFFERQSGWTLWHHADHFIFLPLRSDTTTYLEHASDLKATAIDDLKTLTTRLGEYFGMYYCDRSQSHSRLLRYYPATRFSTQEPVRILSLG